VGTGLRLRPPARTPLTSPSCRQIFISNNLADDEVTTLERIQLFGQSIAPTDMKEFKKVG